MTSPDKLARERERDALRYRRAHPEPTGKYAIRTADPIVREAFLRAYHMRITNREICRRIDRSTTCVTHWRKGVTTPSMLDVIALVEALGGKIRIEWPGEAQ
ncbi:hypothetical protein [Agrobacterium pusense]|uniref:hypothetical protein n=1 Tax=Agrobacterium pusense TaxID=648995 RepID=UPI00384A542E